MITFPDFYFYFVLKFRTNDLNYIVTFCYAKIFSKYWWKSIKKYQKLIVFSYFLFIGLKNFLILLQCWMAPPSTLDLYLGDRLCFNSIA